jgi:DNA-binding CsgD family transcriptional regulator
MRSTPKWERPSSTSTKRSDPTVAARVAAQACRAVSSEEMSAHSRAIHSLVAEALVVEELAPALAALSEQMNASAAGYVRFPRQQAGELGAVVLALGPNAKLAKVMTQGSATVCDAASLGLEKLGKKICGAALNEHAFGERGSAGLIFASDTFASHACDVLTECLESFSVASRRIQRFSALTGENIGFAALVEKRLGACAGLASANGDILWLSQSARSLLGEEGASSLSHRIRQARKEIAPVESSTLEISLQLDNRKRIFGALSFVRESSEASVHYIAIELQGSESEAKALEHKLTRSERDVYDLLMQGLSNEGIAAKRFVSVETVRTHLQRIYRKFEVASRAELLARKRWQ